MSPAAHALDRRLLELRSEHEALTTRLHDLETDATYARLLGGEGMSGATADRLRPVHDRVAGLLPGLEHVGLVVDQVSAGRGGGMLTDDVATALFAQLNSPHIVLPAAPGGLTAHGLLAEVGEALVELQAAVAEVGEVWARFPGRFDEVRAEADRLASTAPELRTVAAAGAALDGLGDRAGADPLGAADDLTTVESALSTAAGAVEEMGRLRDVVQGAGRTLAELDELMGEGSDALVRSRVELREPQGLLDPVDPDVLSGERGLRPWLARLESLVAGGEFGLAAKGLESWTALADKSLAAATAIAEANTRPLQRRRELRELLRAARVKAGASGRAEDPLMSQLARRADEALAAPCCLVTAESEVGAYLVELRHTPTPAQAQRLEESTEERTEMSA